MKVLVVDDNLLTRNMITFILSELKHQAVPAGNGDEAVRLFTEQKPDLVLLDLVMPGKSGQEVMEELKAIDPSVKIVVVTAVQQEEIRKNIMKKGAAAILNKPFTPEELEWVLKQVL